MFSLGLLHIRTLQVCSKLSSSNCVSLSLPIPVDHVTAFEYIPLNHFKYEPKETHCMSNLLQLKERVPFGARFPKNRTLRLVRQRHLVRS
jgi:hypothetical protein